MPEGRQELNQGGNRQFYRGQVTQAVAEGVRVAAAEGAVCST
jgi:hypothetical protein